MRLAGSHRNNMSKFISTIDRGVLYPLAFHCAAQYLTVSGSSSRKLEDIVLWEEVLQTLVHFVMVLMTLTYLLTVSEHA